MKLTSALLAAGIAVAAHGLAPNPAAAGPLSGSGLAGLGAIVPAIDKVGGHVEASISRRTIAGTWRRGYRQLSTGLS